jgi:predicted nucleic acid-binding protein
MRYVVDCSVAVKWEVNEPDSPRAIQLRDGHRHGLHELLAPDIFPLEVANALYTAELKGSLVPGRFEHHLADVLQAAPVLYQSTSLLPRATTILRQAALARIAIYGCLYVALAQREGCQLVTADGKLLRALQSAYPFIIDLATL